MQNELSFRENRISTFLAGVYCFSLSRVIFFLRKNCPKWVKLSEKIHRVQEGSFFSPCLSQIFQASFSDRRPLKNLPQVIGKIKRFVFVRTENLEMSELNRSVIVGRWPRKYLIQESFEEVSKIRAFVRFLIACLLSFFLKNGVL